MADRMVQVSESLIKRAPHGYDCFFTRLSDPIPADCDCWKSEVLMQQVTCEECGGSGVCGGPPDRYYECPLCSGELVDLDDTRDDRDPSTIRDVTPPKEEA